MELILLIAIAVVLTVFVAYSFIKKGGSEAQTELLQNALRQQMQENREELDRSIRGLRMELTQSMSQSLQQLQEALNQNMQRFQESQMQSMRQSQESQGQSMKQLQESQSQSMKQLQEAQNQSIKHLQETQIQSMKLLQDSLDQNMKTSAESQRQRFDLMAQQQDKLVQSTEKRLDDMRLMVEEKLQKTLNERIGQSFEIVRTQLENVQRGLGEMQTLAQDVGGLKKVLTNVKMRGTFGEVQLGALLEQMMSPEQYDVNVKTKKNSTEFVEYAIKLPGKDDSDSTVYLPIDAKFPKDIYEQYYDAFEAGDAPLIELSGRQLEATIKKMAKDIHDKYVDPPYTTDFAILFLPFESIYAEVIRRTSLVETLQREYKIVVTGPTTLGAILNSLQMGFRTLAIQKRSSEVWTVLGAVKTEFETFGGLLEGIQKKLNSAGKDLDIAIGTRTRAISRKLRDVTKLPQEESRFLLPIDDFPDKEEEKED